MIKEHLLFKLKCNRDASDLWWCSMFSDGRQIRKQYASREAARTLQRLSCKSNLVLAKQVSLLSRLLTKASRHITEQFFEALSKLTLILNRHQDHKKVLFHHLPSFCRIVSFKMSLATDVFYPTILHSGVEKTSTIKLAL